MIRRLIPLLALVLVAALPVPAPVQAETLYHCPDLASAEQVGNCPSEDELRRMFRATCGGAQNPNASDPLLCDSFEGFARVKAVVLWEVSTPAGPFLDYMPCDYALGTNRVAQNMSLRCAGRVCTIDCDYGDGVMFGMRVKGACEIAEGGDAGGDTATCGPDGSACAARCP